jgi:dissimilatory sulfite reductase (desulfoviridin) alpha/beta subunit
MMKRETFNLEMPKVGIIKGVLAKDIEVVGEKVVNLRTCARPYRNMYSASQLRTIKLVAEEYGSGKVHLSPRHNLEIPEVRQKDLDRALRELYIAGLFPGGAGTSVRNIFTCPDWCSSSVRPVQEIGMMVSHNFGDRDMPNKVTISFAGCLNGCSRPYNTDIGIVAMAEVVVDGNVCKEGCRACMESCPFDAVEVVDGRVRVTEGCQYCGRCLNACEYGVLKKGRTGFRVLIGGKEGSTVRFGVEYMRWVDDFEVLEIIDRVLRNYQEKAALRPGSTRKRERLSEVIERLGMEAFMEDN